MSPATELMQVLQDIDAAEAAVATMQRINIANTRTNRKMLEIEDYLNIKLKKLYDEIIQENIKSCKQLGDLQLLYGDESKALIRSGVQDVYEVGIEYTARVMDEDNVFLSKANIASIDALTDPIYEFFWRQVDEHIKKKQEKDFEAQTGITFADRTRDIALMTSVELTSNSMTTSILAIATIEKYQELKTVRNKQLMLGRGIAEIKQKDAVVVVFWTKADERVCPICFPLHNVTWDIDDPFIVIPKLMTHPRCRCRLLLKIGDRIYSM